LSTAWILWLLLSIAQGQIETSAPWQTLYEGEEATGDSVIALWQFLPGQEEKDTSGHEHHLVLRGQSRFDPNGRFGSCLRSFPGDKDNDHPQGAMARNHPDLSPSGAFTLELWFHGSPELEQSRHVFLLDKKYYHYPKDLPQANTDYCLTLRRTRGNTWTLLSHLGFGSDSAEFCSDEIQILPGTWYHAAFTYDGRGTGRFFLDGRPVGRITHEGRAGITPGSYPLVLGDRYGSIHAGFPGHIDQVRLSSGRVSSFSGALEINVGLGRLSFVRMEKNALIPLILFNDTPEDLSPVRLSCRYDDQAWETILKDLPSCQSHLFEIPFDSSLRPDSYEWVVSAEAPSLSKSHEAEIRFTVNLVPRPLPHTMPVLMWGTGDLDTLQRIGFTHHLVHLADYEKIWAAGQPTDAASQSQSVRHFRMLDECLAHGIGAAVVLHPGRWVMGKEDLKDRFQRVDRTGKPREHDNACAAHPDLLRFGYDVGASVAKTFGSHPGLQACLIHSEIRDHTGICFHDHDREGFLSHAGFDIPVQAQAKGGVRYENLQDITFHRIVRDDHPLLTFYRWFWKEGDGWNPLHTRVHEGLHSTERDDLWSFFDPAVRVPSLWGSGGAVDVVSQWTYSYPDPIKIGQATDQLFAMAEGFPGQRVMKMTQIIWYRSQTAPNLPEDDSRHATWEKEIPDARFITIAPDHLREAFWSKISRPIQGIMYHGWASLVPSQHGSYRYTHPQTQEVLSQLIRDVVKPLGPTLLQVGDKRTDVALLESFTSQMFANRGTWGWSSSWEADMHLILQWAHLQPRILYEECLSRDGLNEIRVLVMPFCDVLPQSVLEKIATFQRQGGLIVADETLTPALHADVLIPSYKRKRIPHEDKAALQERSRLLRTELDPFYQAEWKASEQDVVLRVRSHESTDYLFALNDRRQAGEYVGHHGWVMEEGVPIEADISCLKWQGIPEEQVHIYDLVSHEKIPMSTSGRDAFHARFQPGEGKLFMITRDPIQEVRIHLPEVENPLSFQVFVLGPQEKTLQAVIPVRVEILDPMGRLAEGSGYYGAPQGSLSLSLDLARNDVTGEWTLLATELASGLSSTAKFLLR